MGARSASQMVATEAMEIAPMGGGMIGLRLTCPVTQGCPLPPGPPVTHLRGNR